MLREILLNSLEDNTQQFYQIIEEGMEYLNGDKPRFGCLLFLQQRAWTSCLWDREKKWRFLKNESKDMEKWKEDEERGERKEEAKVEKWDKTQTERRDCDSRDCGKVWTSSFLGPRYRWTLKCEGTVISKRHVLLSCILLLNDEISILS
jgi:hypothetical protein